MLKSLSFAFREVGWWGGYQCLTAMHRNITTDTAAAAVSYPDQIGTLMVVVILQASLFF